MALKWNRVRRIALWIFMISLILLFLLSYLRYLDIKKTLILKASEKATSIIGQEVHAEDLSLSLPAAINLYGITLKNPEGFPPGQLLRIKRLRLDMRPRELLKGRLAFKNIVLYSPEFTLSKDGKGKWNISDGLMRFISGKPMTHYQVDELRIDSGVFNLNGDERYRSDRIDLRLMNLSSNPGTKTEIMGTASYAGSRIDIDGRVFPKDIPTRVHLSLSSKDFTLSAFRKLLIPYRIDTEKTRMNIVLHAEGDTEKGFQIKSDLQLRRIGFFLFSKPSKDIRVITEAMFSFHDYSLAIQAATLSVDGVPTARGKGMISDLKKNPSYRAEIKIERLDLSDFNLIKDLKVRGIMTSKDLRIAGRPEMKIPKISGDFQLREGAIESPYGIFDRMDANLILSSDKEISIKGEAFARVVRVGKYIPGKPFEARVSGSIQGIPGQFSVTSFLSLSSFEMKSYGGEPLRLENVLVMMEGMMKGDTFSGRNSLEINGLRLAGRFLQWFKSNSSIAYQKNEVNLRDLTIETEDMKSSTAYLRITMPNAKSDYTVEIRGADAAYRTGEATIKQADLFVGIRQDPKTISGDLRFSAGNISLQGMAFAQVVGEGRFDEKTFSINLSRADFSGGKIRFTADGRTSENPFPLKVKILAEAFDLSLLSNSLWKSLRLPYTVAGDIQQATFEGVIDSQQSIRGNGSLNARKVSISNPSTGRSFVKDASFHADIESMGKDLALKSEVAAGILSTRLSGRVEGFLEKDRHLHLKGTLPRIKVSDIRNSLWDIFPDSLLYVGLQGSISSNFSIDYSKEGLDMRGNLLFADFILDGENGEYSVGPINGILPIGYSKGRGDQEVMKMYSFERSQFDHLINDYSREPVGEGFQRLTIGSLRYGFQLFDHINLWIKQKGDYLNIEHFSANIFSGRLYGFATIDLSNEFQYGARLLVKGLSLNKLCDSIEPIKGFISGNADGIATFKGSGIGISQLIGMADFWTYRTGSEKTMISKEFLQEVGGPSIKAYARNRPFNKGILSLYVKDGYLIFKELEISNKNLLGITDLSVKVAPMSNRIAIDHLLWAIAEAAERAKKKK
jgi:hypothetical protein